MSVRLRTGVPVTVGNLPGVWITGRYRGGGWWEVTPKTSTPGLVALAACGSIEARRKDIVPLPTQETLL